MSLHTSLIWSIIPCSVPAILALIGIVVWAVLMFKGNHRLVRAVIFGVSVLFCNLNLYGIGVGFDWSIAIMLLVVTVVGAIKIRYLVRESRLELILYLLGWGSLCVPVIVILDIVINGWGFA